MEQLAELKIKEGFDVVVMGHRHVPLRKPIGSGVYINLGDWISYNTYGVLTNGVIELKTWNNAPAD
jgi:UDP-2,3-diacylglucosamine hydrolase